MQIAQTCLWCSGSAPCCNSVVEQLGSTCGGGACEGVKRGITGARTVAIDCMPTIKPLKEMGIPMRGCTRRQDASRCDWFLLPQKVSQCFGIAHTLTVHYRKTVFIRWSNPMNITSKPTNIVFIRRSKPSNMSTNVTPMNLFEHIHRY
jgi:hypothetical protein